MINIDPNETKYLYRQKQDTGAMRKLCKRVVHAVQYEYEVLREGEANCAG